MVSPSYRIHMAIRGAVQGVGFRPFVYRLAREIGLKGWIENCPQGVFLEIEGTENRLSTFQERLRAEKPPHASIQSLESTYLDPLNYREFQIRPSKHEGAPSAVILPDISTCQPCLSEIFDPENRRYQYPFTNCTNCGPRYSIIHALPYDRVNTSMREFALCPQCDKEYHDPLDRRFHAQPNACPDCGPQLQLLSPDGSILAEKEEALERALNELKQGKIVALKGIGGFQLLTRADSKRSVDELRLRKKRGYKPFAVLFPTFESVLKVCCVTKNEAQLLKSPEAPIVLLEQNKEAHEKIASSVAPGNPYLGVMLPYSPLHHLLTAGLSIPLVATSGNLSNEPICINNKEAVKKLGPLVDFLLVHDRPIVRQVDDSIARIIEKRELILRRARGYAPLPIHLSQETPPLLALGAQQKNALAIAFENQAILSQHIGDLETVETLNVFEETAQSLTSLYQKEPVKIICDSHPDYLSTRFAAKYSQPKERVQHHYAHLLSCMAENQLEAPVLGVAWDGTGLGDDGTLWGGEFLLIGSKSYKKVAGLRPFLLPGNSQAIKEPRRVALALLHTISGENLLQTADLPITKYFTAEEWNLLTKMLHKKLNSPVTSSMGRLFDGVSSLLGLCQINSFEGQAAMDLEFAAKRSDCGEIYPFKVDQFIDWGSMVLAILEDLSSDVPVSKIAKKFHNTLVEFIITVAKQVGESRVVLSGGCFQNKYLLETTIQRLRDEGFVPYWHQRVPPNDGGIALGQLWAAIR